MDASFAMQTNNTSSISARVNAAGASELIAPVIHRSGSARTASQNMSLSSNEGNEKSQSVSLSGGGGVGPCSLYLGFGSVNVKIYIGNPYTIRKISSSSFRWLSLFFNGFLFRGKI